MKTTIKTKFGTAKLCGDGYYHITGFKEGNNGKRLHRLIYEDYYGVSLLSTTDVHHIDGDKTNNDIHNLELLDHRQHAILHLVNSVRSNDVKLKIAKTVSKNNNSTGYFRVSKQKAACKQGFTWKYSYHDETGKRKAIYSIDICTLKEKVLARGLEWLPIIKVETEK